MNAVPSTQSLFEKCVKCGNAVNAKGVDPNRWCVCVCEWPDRGCGARIFFRLNMNQRVQPFDLDGGKPHHATCVAYRRKTQGDKLCPACGGARAKGRGCRHCGWEPGDPPKMRHRPVWWEERGKRA